MRLITWMLLGLLSGVSVVEPANGSLRFFGNGVNDIDRVKIQIDDPANSNPGPPADIGATDFTIEWWMKAQAADNPAGTITCGANNNWINGNIVVDRDRYNQSQNFGISLGNGRVVFGVMGDSSAQRTICGTSSVLDNAWHHIAVQRQRSDGAMSLYVDGTLQASATGAQGPDGDISYPDNGTPGSFCGAGGNQPCTGSDPYLVLAAEKHDAGSSFPSYNGFLDELRLSNTLRYSSNFTRPSAPFTTDANTMALYHMDEGTGTTLTDTSGASGGPSPGVLKVGGSPTGPIWSTDVPFTDTLAPSAPTTLMILTP